jgi:hypothetical protein
MRLDAEGYRLDQNGQRIGEVDIPAKTPAKAPTPWRATTSAAAASMRPARS